MRAWPYTPKNHADGPPLSSGHADPRNSTTPRDSHLPVARLHPEGSPTGDAILRSPAAVDAFSAAWRGLLSALESDFPDVRRLHVAAAVPVPAAIAIGRFHRTYMDPTLVMYELGDDKHYTKALEIPA